VARRREDDALIEWARPVGVRATRRQDHVVARASPRTARTRGHLTSAISEVNVTTALRGGGGGGVDFVEELEDDVVEDVGGPRP